ncbi:Cation/calcium exchanger 2 [Glycine soja]
MAITVFVSKRMGYTLFLNTCFLVICSFMIVHFHTPDVMVVTKISAFDSSNGQELSPTIAGVTLLSLGNGAPDVFSSLVSFQESGTRDMGFNTVLGGVSFVSCVVVGSVSIAIRQSGVQVAKSAFVRDVYFLLFVVLALFVIVYASFTRWKEGGDDDERGGIGISDCDNDLSLGVPLLNGGFVMSVTWSYIIAQELVENPQPVVIPRDPYLWETMVFLVAGLVWALVVLRKTDMKLDGLLGGGLLFVYFLSLFIRLIQTKGSLQ